jgi:hypothetical protein
LSSRATKRVAFALACATIVASGYVLGALRPERRPDGLPDTSQAAHASGVCGDMKPGTGLIFVDEGEVRGWVASMIRGEHEFRVRGAGSVKPAKFDYQEQQTASVALSGVTKASVLEWKIPGARVWERVPTAFLYPQIHPERSRLFELAIKNDTPFPGFKDLRPSQMKDPARLVPPEQQPLKMMEADAKRQQAEWDSKHLPPND